VNHLIFALLRGSFGWRICVVEDLSATPPTGTAACRLRQRHRV